MNVYSYDGRVRNLSPEKGNVTIDEFYNLRENSNQIMEYIDGVIFMSPSPFIKQYEIRNIAKPKGQIHSTISPNFIVDVEKVFA